MNIKNRCFPTETEEEEEALNDISVLKYPS